MKLRFLRPRNVPVMAILVLLSICTGTAGERLDKSLAGISMLEPLRGGATKKLSKPRKTVSSSKSKTSSKTATSNQQQLPSVQAILIPRKINLLRVVQTSSFACMLVSLVHCVLTAGRPFVQTVWAELYAPAMMPETYKPSQWDKVLTRHAVLPPPFLPSPKPLVAMLLATMLYVSLGLLFPRWFASSYGVALEYKHVDSLDASVIKGLNTGDKLAALVSVPREARIYTDNKALMVCPLHSEAAGQKKKGSALKHHFDLCNQRYYYDKKDATVVSGAPTLQHESVRNLVNHKGLVTKSKFQTAHAEFDAYNRIQIPSPTIVQAFWARLASPLVVLQLFGKLLAALEDPSWIHTLLSMGTTLSHHYWNARQSIVSARELSKEVHDQEASMVQVRVKRSKNKWTRMNAVELLPGDIFELAACENLAMPVDAVILKGSAVANEAVLTGESVAQSKVALEASDETALDMIGRHRSSVFFAGSTILHSPQPIVCIALRTGSYSSRGDLLRALQKSRVGAVSNPQTERDGLRLMASLGVVACASCTWFWTTTMEDISVFRKILQCSRILLAAIPSDLPLVLAGIAHACAQQLRRKADVVCSEPGMLLTASTVNHVLFDKTGTLTADTQSLSQIQTIDGTENAGSVDFVLAGCHSLVKLKGELVGDPLDLASLRYSDWKANKNGSYTKEGTTIWQIKSFPFDASRRTSSALILVRDEQRKLSLYKVIKGSPTVVQDLVEVNKGDFGGAVSYLGQQGHRIVATAIQNVTDDTPLVEQLFELSLTDVKPTKKVIEKARTLAQDLLSRDSFETNGYDFCGFLCFEAAVRPSTPRIIRELQQAKMGITMLTGDGVDAAVAVAKRCQIIPEGKDVVLLDRIDSKLCWRRLGEGQTSNKAKAISTRRVLSNDRYARVATGRAVQGLFEKDHLDSEEELLKSKLQDFVVIASASPSQKVAVATMLKSNKRKVLMCGDGVNDVAAMKIADCGVALLNGFGDGSTGDRDLEDERRRESVQEKRIGSNRRRRRTVNPTLGRSFAANRARVKAMTSEALLEVKRKAAARQGISDPNDKSVKLTFEEAKESFAAVSAINQAERERSKLLKKGGAGAAKILAEADSTFTGADADTNIDIKPGEASLVSPFSCLRPAIDGVEAILRQSVAAASYMHVMHQSVALNCLQSAFYLATLYKNGFRYGKHMFNVEFFLYVLTDQAAQQAACTPRPRLSTLRPSASMFSPFSIMSVIGQFYVHASTRMVGVRLANRLEAAFIEPNPTMRRIEVAGSPFLALMEKKPIDLLLRESLVKAPIQQPDEKRMPAILKLFQRTPFKPNYATNVVFLFSVIQPSISTLVSFKGRPFHGAVLEHRPLIVGIGLSILFVLSMLAEGVKPLNDFLELRLLPNTRAQLCLFAVFGIDAIGCWIVGTLCRFGSGAAVVAEETPSQPESDDIAMSAAVQEEKLLAEEADENGSLVRIMASATSMIFLSSLARTLEAQV